jgi:large subunit ribosomal protein L9
MKVLFLKDIAGSARKNEVKEVAEGYARNFLFPKNIAVPATDAILRIVEGEKAHKVAEIEKEKKRYDELAEKLKSVSIVFKVKIGERGKAFGSVSPQKIVDELQKRGIVIEKSWLAKESLKTTGEHMLKISFPHGIHGVIRVIIEKE